MSKGHQKKTFGGMVALPILTGAVLSGGVSQCPPLDINVGDELDQLTSTSEFGICETMKGSLGNPLGTPDLPSKRSLPDELESFMAITASASTSAIPPIS